MTSQVLKLTGGHMINVPYPYRPGKYRVNRICKYCNKQYTAPLSGRILFCDSECYRLWQIGNTIAEKNNSWKGKEVGYHGIHKWVGRRFTKPDNCERCGEHKELMEWSNNDGKYSRNRKDWEYLCVQCHRKKDAWHRTRHYKGSRWNKVFESRLPNAES